ncbi:MAG: hypothetical protein OEU95_05790, partial [Nitrospirota bacterium]|nr:hypothetical protein [Nitrospirota bacterium]
PGLPVRKVEMNNYLFTKSPLTPLFQRGELPVFPLWKRRRKGIIQSGSLQNHIRRVPGEMSK